MVKSQSTKSRTADAPFLPPQWPAASVEMWPMDKIEPYDGNPKQHPQEQIDALAADMKADGVTQPILVDEQGVIIAGHGRRLAALQNGFKEYPVVVARGWSEQQKRSARIRDNQRSLQAKWDTELIRAEIEALKVDGYDVKLLGFTDTSLRTFGIGLLQPAGPDVEQTPQPPKRPVSRPGDLWVMGGHRLLCAGSDVKENWKRLMNGQRAQLVFTDPPYGVSYKGANFEVIEGDHKRRDDLYRLLVDSLRGMVASAKDDAAIYIWHASSTRRDFEDAMKAVGIAEKQYLIWAKPAPVLGRADYHWQHEPCFYAAKDQRTPKFVGDRAQSTVWHLQVSRKADIATTIGSGIVLLDGKGGMIYVQAKAPKAKRLREVRIPDGGHAFLTGTEIKQSTVWQVSKDGAEYEHPTQKPVELARRAIENSTAPGDIVIDGFLGSGTSLIGAEATGRRCFGCELDPIYADVIVTRWQTIFGQEAVLESGETFEATRKARAKRKK